MVMSVATSFGEVYRVGDFRRSTNCPSMVTSSLSIDAKTDGQCSCLAVHGKQTNNGKRNVKSFGAEARYPFCLGPKDIAPADCLVCMSDKTLRECLRVRCEDIPCHRSAFLNATVEAPLLIVPLPSPPTRMSPRCVFRSSQWRSADLYWLPSRLHLWLYSGPSRRIVIVFASEATRD